MLGFVAESIGFGYFKSLALRYSQTWKGFVLQRLNVGSQYIMIINSSDFLSICLNIKHYFCINFELFLKEIDEPDNDVYPYNQYVVTLLIIIVFIQR